MRSRHRGWAVALATLGAMAACSAQDARKADLDGGYLYVYLVPFTNGNVVRFEARTTPSMPPLPAFFGSFF